MTETGGNNADNDEPAKQANGLDIILSLACAGSFVIAIICYLIFKLMQYDAVALITCTIGFISFCRNADNRFDSHDSSIENQNTNHHDYSNAKRLCRNHGFNVLNTLWAMKTKFA